MSHFYMWKSNKNIKSLFGAVGEENRVIECLSDIGGDVRGEAN